MTDKGGEETFPLPPIPSSPRKREPIYPLGSKSEIVERWVPAFAGMTALGTAASTQHESFRTFGKTDRNAPGLRRERISMIRKYNFSSLDRRAGMIHISLVTRWKQKVAPVSTTRKEVIRCLMVQQRGRSSPFGERAAKHGFPSLLARCHVLRCGTSGR